MLFSTKHVIGTHVIRTHSLLRFVTLVFALCFSSLSFSHALKVFAYFEGNVIKGSVYFVGGAPAKEANVRLLTRDGQVLGAVVTDQNGEFKTPPVMDTFVQVEADSRDGHIGVWEVTNPKPKAGNMSSGTMSSGTMSSETESSKAMSSKPSSIKTMPDGMALNGQDAASSALTAEALEVMIERAVAAQVAPLREELHRYQNSARLSDILGGLGVIFGLAGGALWLKSRKPNESNE
ncbi:hypothetical protein [Litoribrevibacter albus]|uniref:Cobalt ABC transporter permease n=1 Tax=Litoribrevibacter albus TaxID=1473156 RepID=A0AA37W5R2_9GAMM|nr:hypothetical protein [Litoribrevibacter albus]GLQ30805.1 hypothetical protein GCM10007876_12840 [Litoribrevibacter albus]